MFFTQLELADNKIASGLEPLLQCPELRELVLAHNRIEAIESLEPLVSLGTIALHSLKLLPVLFLLDPITSLHIDDCGQSCKQKKLTKLEKLDLFESPIASSSDYTVSVFDYLPQIKYLDSFDRYLCPLLFASYAINLVCL